MPLQQELLIALNRLVAASESFVGSSEPKLSDNPDVDDYWAMWTYRNTEAEFESALESAKTLLRQEASMVKSADGKGRTILEMLTGQNKKDLTPQEFQFHNPLQAKIGCSVSVSYEAELAGYNFFVETIAVGETTIGDKKFHHTDYNLRATVIGKDKPIRLKLRLIPDEDSSNEIGHTIQVLRPYLEFGWKFADENNFLDVLADEEGVFKILTDLDGNQIEEDAQPTYWRVDDVRDPYKCRVTVLKDTDGDGIVTKDELRHADFLIWDYSRDTTDETTKQSYREFLNVEEEVEYKDGDPQCVWFTVLMGRAVEAFQVVVI
jgi:hypothetical protein